jgi:hypothetical protein
MVSNLIIGLLTMAVCVAIQCLIMAKMLRTLYHFEQRGWLQSSILGISSVLIVITLIILTGNLLQIALWAGVFLLTDEFQLFSNAFYHSVVNFSTLGYGDIVMSESRRLLGALEALNGVLMIGLSTGALFAVLNGFMRKVWSERGSHHKSHHKSKAGSRTRTDRT